MRRGDDLAGGVNAEQQPAQPDRQDQHRAGRHQRIVGQRGGHPGAGLEHEAHHRVAEHALPAGAAEQAPLDAARGPEQHRHISLVLSGF